MSSVVIAGDTSGTVTLQAPAVAGSTVLTLPAVSGTVSTLGTALTSATAQASTSGTSIDFTGIPSWVKRITVMFNGVSTNGTSLVQVQVGAGSVTTTGYVSSSQQSTSVASSTTGLVITMFPSAADIRIGAVVISNITGNTWVSQGNVGQNTSSCSCCGSITLSGALDRVRITTVNGTDAFDAGSINIMYE